MDIRHVGERYSKILANQYGSIDALMRASVEELDDIPDIGEKVAESIYKYFCDDNNRLLIERLRKSGVKLEALTKKGVGPDIRFTGKTFVLTGKMESMTRGDAAGMIEERGGRVSSSVSKNTDFLVAGEKAGSKLKKAEDNGVTIIGEAELRDMLGLA
jgi:DNA ligase (NAD+)